ncbi:LssY C-terminal domain-containing protein [Nesterenkonia populi]|uniref:LssY C-terminal domain-containing protein n=1 Tax=Nesterenkonia populi TaxID=1591087 RepID=UPI0011BFCAF4|nr:LssY C-terminal domain-containing protein [Nesterenkonia populi]
MTAMGVRRIVSSVPDGVFFVFGVISSVWFAILFAVADVHWGWGLVGFAIAFWLLLAYLVLPRLHNILTRIYVPGYFIGRARTSDGLLGDPVNLAFRGDESQVHAVMRSAGWIKADDLTFNTSRRIVTSTLRRHSYPEAPVSPLLLFDRQQDFAYQQEVHGTPGQRHHVRFWRCPPGWMLPGGFDADWLAAATYDRRVGLSLFTLQITHKIAQDTDAERDHLTATISEAEPSVVVSVIEDYSTGYHSRNGGGDSIATDGDLPILDVRPVHELGLSDSADQPGAESRNRTPIMTVVGAALTGARGLAAFATAAALLFGRDDDGTVRTIDGSALGLPDNALLFGLVAVLATFAVAELFICWRVLHGGNAARLFAMTLSAAAIVVHSVTYGLGVHSAALHSGLVGLGLDILLVCALSSAQARTYADRPSSGASRMERRDRAASSMTTDP